MKNNRFRILSLALAMLVITVTVTGNANAAGYLLVPIHDTVDGGMAAFVERGIKPSS